MSMKINKSEFSEKVENLGDAIDKIKKLTPQETTGSKKTASEEDSYVEVGSLTDDTKKDSYTILDFKSAIANNKKLDGLDDNFDSLEAFKAFDKDGDGLVSSEEIGKVASGHDDFSDFSLDEFQAVISDSKDKKTSSNKSGKKTSSKKQKTTTTPNTTTVNQTPTTTTVTPTATTVAPTTVTSTPVTYTSVPSTSSGSVTTGAQEGNETNSSPSVDDKIKKLQESRTTKEGELEDLNDDLSNALDGTDSEISDAKETMDGAEEEYENLLESEAEDNEEVKKLKDKKDANDSKLETNEKDTIEAEKDYNEKSQEVVDQETLISNLENQRGAYQDALDEVNSQTVTDTNKAIIKATKEQIEDEIDKLDEKIKKEEKTLKDLKTSRDKADKKISSLETEKEELVSTRDSIEKDLMDTVSSETKEALVAYQKARETYEEDKDKRVSAVKGDIKTKQDEIAKIDEDIQALEAEKIKEENKPDPMSLYDSEKGKALANAAIKRCNGNTQSGGRCGAGVGDSIESAFGYDITQDGCDYDDVLSKRDDWVEITDLYPDAASMTGAYDPEKGTGLPPGAVVSWSPYSVDGTEHPYGHSYVADGEGMEYSDYIHEITTYFADNGSTYRIFVPKS